MALELHPSRPNAPGKATLWSYAPVYLSLLHVGGRTEDEQYQERGLLTSAVVRISATTTAKDGRSWYKALVRGLSVERVAWRLGMSGMGFMVTTPGNTTLLFHSDQREFPRSLNDEARQLGVLYVSARRAPQWL